MQRNEIRRNEDENRTLEKGKNRPHNRSLAKIKYFVLKRACNNAPIRMKGCMRFALNEHCHLLMQIHG
jgi:hypothetical protein